MTMSWLADRNATTTAASAVAPRIDQRIGNAERTGSPAPAPPGSANAQPRRRPSRAVIPGSGSRSISGAHRNLKLYESAHQREQADRGQRHADFGQPQRQRRAGQRQRQPAGKPHQQDRDEARLRYTASQAEPSAAMAASGPGPGTAASLIRQLTVLRRIAGPQTSKRHPQSSAVGGPTSPFFARAPGRVKTIALESADCSAARRTSGNAAN